MRFVFFVVGTIVLTLIALFYLRRCCRQSGWAFVFYPTCELVDELMKRKGVKTKTVEPHVDHTVSVNGPAIILVVTD
jgi:hypothetical protein